jgi:hypothetical protein
MSRERTKMRRRTGPILLAVLALVTGPTTVADAHPATPGIAIPDPNGTIHGCYQNTPPILSILPIQRRLRVIPATESCLVTLTILGIPILTLPIDNSVDWPATGVLTNLVESGPMALPLMLPAGAGQLGSANLNCPPGRVAIGLAGFSTSAPTAPAALIGTSRSGAPSGNTLTATFANLFPAPATISDLKALCVTLFAP